MRGQFTRGKFVCKWCWDHREREAEREGKKEKTEKKEEEKVKQKVKGKREQRPRMKRKKQNRHIPHTLGHILSAKPNFEGKRLQKKTFGNEFGKRLRYVTQSTVHKRTN